MKDIHSLNNLINNSIGVLEIDDEFKIHRIRAYFCLDDEYENQGGESIFNILLSFRDESIFHTLICLKLLGKLITSFNSVYVYIKNYASVNIRII